MPLATGACTSSAVEKLCSSAACQAMHDCIAIFENCKFLKMLAIRKSHFPDCSVEKAVDGFLNILPKFFALRRGCCYPLPCTLRVSKVILPATSKPATQVMNPSTSEPRGQPRRTGPDSARAGSRHVHLQ
ncbi:MAG: hypothetical protein H0W33_11845 [Gammaproteobacteria bacterium]|nr:hypothetical protein [Gammaproteobacteria bacterium]